MTKEEKISKIYEVIADKTISDWLIYEKFWVKFDYCKICQNRIDEEDIIIWHPVMIWDVLNWIDWFTDRGAISQIILDTVFIWWKKNTPIEDQSEECIDFIYNLL